jgi:hypothetical protein
MDMKGMKDMTVDLSVQQKVVTRYSRTGRLLRLLLQPPPVGPLPAQPPATVLNAFARRLAKHPPDLVTHLGMVRSNAYYAAGCPLALCDHAAARDLWRVIHQEVLGGERTGKDGHGTGV